jgi:hypothetical protein
MTPNNAVTASNMANIPWPSADDLTAEVATQSKEFREKLNFESLMMILCNRLRQGGTMGLGCAALKAGLLPGFRWNVSTNSTLRPRLPIAEPGTLGSIRGGRLSLTLAILRCRFRHGFTNHQFRSDLRVFDLGAV